MEYERYQRQIRLSNFGPEAQTKLLQARILVIGAGGLGCPALQYLAAAGVGTIGIIDFDVVSISNLHRQVLYTADDVGKSKVACAKDALLRLNPTISIITYSYALEKSNALALLSSYDLIIDGSDNFATRYLVSDVTEILQLPLVYGAVSKFEGQVAVFNVADQSGTKTTYRDLFPQQPSPNEIENCADGGVLGVLPGIIGTLQATEAIKMLTGVGQPLYNQLLSYQALYNQFYTITISPDPNRPAATKESFDLQQYNTICTTGSTGISAISLEEVESLRTANCAFTVIDVREYSEFPYFEATELVQIPLSILKSEAVTLPLESETLITTCASGKRSITAASLLYEKLGKPIRYYEGSISDLFDL